MVDNELLKLLQDQLRQDYVTKEVSDVYRGVAQKTGRTPEEIAKIGGVESNHGKYDTNFKGSKAKGLFQIMPSISSAFKTDEIPVSNLNKQEELMSELILDNTKRSKGEIPVEDLYLLHNLGLGKARKFMKSDENSPVNDILSKKIINDNDKFYKNKTVGEAKEEIKQFLEERGDEFRFRPLINEFFKEKNDNFKLIKNKMKK